MKDKVLPKCNLRIGGRGIYGYIDVVVKDIAVVSWQKTPILT